MTGSCYLAAFHCRCYCQSLVHALLHFN